MTVESCTIKYTPTPMEAEASLVDVTYEKECTTMMVWSKLGREGSKGLQLASATYHLLLNCSYLSWQMATANTIEQATRVNPYTKPFFLVCHVALACGPISYLLNVYQLLLMDI